MTKHLVGAVVLAALFVSPAVGADLGAKAPVYKAPPVPPAVYYNWSGFYVGGNVGGAWGRHNPTTIHRLRPRWIFCHIQRAGHQRGWAYRTSIPGASPAASKLVTIGKWVPLSFGFEADINYLGLRGSTTGSALYPCCAPTGFTIASSVSPGWLFTWARPRIAGRWTTFWST
jgi:outer membrane immunogenic protein